MTIRVLKLIDFSSVADGWHVHDWTVGPTGDVTLLLADQPQPWQFVPSVEPDASFSWRAPVSGHRLLHFADGHDGSRRSLLEIPGDQPIASAARFVDGRWLTVLWPRGRDSGPNARVVSEGGEPLSTFWIGTTGSLQLTGDGRIWTGYGDETIYAGSELESGGVVCLDDRGEALFKFNQEAAGEIGAPGVWCAGGINVVSDAEVWESFYADTRIWNDPRVAPANYALARIDGYNAARLWPWAVVTSKTRADTPGAFAVHNEHLLVQGRIGGQRKDDTDTYHPSARIFSISLSNRPAIDLLPVEEDGHWIGPFVADGRGSKLYLATRQALYVVDAASIQAPSTTS